MFVCWEVKQLSLYFTEQNKGSGFYASASHISFFYFICFFSFFYLLGTNSGSMWNINNPNNCLQENPHVKPECINNQSVPTP